MLTREYFIQGEGDGTACQPVNCGLGCFRNKTKYFSLHLQPIFCWLTTEQAVDPFTLYRDFHENTNNKICDYLFFLT